ncbi:hypothetical protein GW17_00038446 [Ensete ventricosum]|nr:hypothetical protein GW17_00038446 [Ensete ventricosum]RZS01955.1 hypothetical protein BHM03_00031916 [Ensete ventricosum]
MTQGCELRSRVRTRPLRDSVRPLVLRHDDDGIPTQQLFILHHGLSHSFYQPRDIGENDDNGICGDESSGGGDRTVSHPLHKLSSPRPSLLLRFHLLRLEAKKLFTSTCFASKNVQQREDLLRGVVVVVVFLRPRHCRRWPSAAPGDGFTGQDRRQDSGESGDSYHR